MAAPRYYELLEVSQDAAAETVKAAYHRAAKRNHPDLFPETEREVHEMRMMEINAAYMAILCDHAGHRAGERPPAAQPPVSERVDAQTQAVAPLKDPAYTYYKLGFRYFSEGRRTFFKRYMTGRQRIDFNAESIDVLKLAVASLHYFHKAYGCFDRVVRDYAQSVWARDSQVKIYYLNRYNVIYHRICNNLSKQISESDPAQSAAARADGDEAVGL